MDTDRKVDRLIERGRRGDVIEENLNKAGKSRKGRRFLIASICYTIMLFVVVYGMFDYVYDGFPGFVPFMIIAIFGIMAVRRFADFCNVQKKLNRSEIKKR